MRVVCSVSQPWLPHSHMGENWHVVQLCMPAWAHSLVTTDGWNSVAHSGISEAFIQPWWAPFWNLCPMRKRLPTVEWLSHCFTFQRCLWALPHLSASHFFLNSLVWDKRQFCPRKCELHKACSQFLQVNGYNLNIPIAKLYLLYNVILSNFPTKNVEFSQISRLVLVLDFFV